MTLFVGVLQNRDGCVFDDFRCCTNLDCRRTPTPVPIYDPVGRPIFQVSNREPLIVIEGRRGANGLSPGTSLQPVAPSNRPDFWVQSTKPLGNGSGAVCDTGQDGLPAGGIPGFVSPDLDFDMSNGTITDAFNDFACRFQVFSSASPCTMVDNSGVPSLIKSNAEVQFCARMAAAAAFQFGDSVLSVVLRDGAGNVGPTAQIVVRVLTPTPTP